MPEKISQEEEEMQKSVVLGSVMGAKTDETQMRFYEEGKVLGEQVGKEIKKEQKLEIGRIFLGILEAIDRAILNLWARVFSS